MGEIGEAAGGLPVVPCRLGWGELFAPRVTAVGQWSVATQRVAVVCDFSIACDSQNAENHTRRLRGQRNIPPWCRGPRPTCDFLWPRGFLAASDVALAVACFLALPSPRVPTFRAVRGVVHSMVYQWTTLRPYKRPTR